MSGEYITAEEFSSRIHDIIDLYPMHEHDFILAFVERIPGGRKCLDEAPYGITITSPLNPDTFIGIPPALCEDGPTLLLFPGFYKNIPNWLNCAVAKKEDFVTKTKLN